MAKVATCVCEKCGDSFTINLEEYIIKPGMRLKFRKQDDAPKPIRTWVDWIDHVMNNCPNCRFPNPPFQAVEDLERFQKKD